MKRLWIASVILVLLLGGSLLNAWYAQQLTGDWIGRLEQAQELARSERWAQAEELTHQIYADWEASHFYLHTFMKHSDTDQILRGFRSVLQYLDIQELDQYAAANVDLIAQIQLLAEMEQASVVNVL